MLTIIITEIVLAKVIPFFKDKERLQNAIAGATKKIVLDKFLFKIFFSGIIVIDIVGIALIGFPILCDIMGFDYTLTLILWCIPTIFDSTVFILLNKEVVYDDNSFTVRNAFGTRKTYLYSEIISVQKKRNMKIKTRRGNILLFNCLYGVNEFHTFIREKLKGSI